MPTASKRSLLNLLVKKKLQMKLSASIGIILLVRGISMWSINLWAVNFVMGSSQESAFLFAGYLHQIRLITAVAGLIFVAIYLLMVLLLTHYIAGPIYRFERVFEQMEKGDLSMTVRLRRNDELQDTAMVLNRAIAALREKVKV